MFGKKIKEKISPKIEAILTDSGVVVSGEDFEREMSPEDFVSYLRGVGSYNEISRRCGAQICSLIVYGED